MDELWRGIVWRQFGAAIDMLENSMRNCSPELWGKRMWVRYAEFSEFWYVAYHTLFWLDLYLGGSVEGFSHRRLLRWMSLIQPGCSRRGNTARTSCWITWGTAAKNAARRSRR